MITACVCSVNHKLSELSCPTHWFLQLTTSSLSYLSSQWKHFLFLFVALLVTANRSQCELRAASTKLHWRIYIWSDIKSSKIPSIRIGLRHSACYPDMAEEVKVKHVEKTQRKNTVGGNQSTQRKPTKRNSCRTGDSNRRPSCCEVTVPCQSFIYSLWVKTSSVGKRYHFCESHSFIIAISLKHVSNELILLVPLKTKIRKSKGKFLSGSICTE